MAFPRFASFAAGFRSLALLLGVLALAGCGALEAPDEAPVRANVRVANAKGDAKPHPGVARAHAHPIQGIDVSKWQDGIDWPAVRRAGTRFAFIKATEGGDHLDARFMENWHGAKAAGVPRSAYLFIWWCRPAAEQADWYIRNVPRDPDALPPVIDAEWNSDSRNCTRRVSREDALAKIRIISARLTAHYGKLPIIYTDINFHRDVLEGVHLDNPFWLRSTAAEPRERYRGRRWMLWQFTQTGRVPGIRGNVDRNVFYGSEKAWAAFVRTGCDPHDLHRLKARYGCDGTGMVAPPPIEEPLVAAAPAPVPAVMPAAVPPQPVAPVIAASATGPADLTAFIDQLTVPGQDQFGPLAGQ
jgi:lysozyme